MLPEKQKNTNIGVGVGLLLQIVGNVMARQESALGLVGLVIALVGLAVFVWGCWNYAEGKGYPGPLGLLGLLSCLGLLVLVVLPDKHKVRR